MKKANQSYLKQLSKYSMIMEAQRRNEGFRRDTDKAFAKFWEREGDSLKKRQMNEIDDDGNIISSMLLEVLIKEPEVNPHVLDAYCYSQEAIQVCKEYGLLYPYHYNQPGIPSLSPGQEMIFSTINSAGSVSVIDGETVRLFRSPCLQAQRKSLNHLDVKINLGCSKQEIMKIFEMVLDDALHEIERAGTKTKTRGLVLDFFPFRVWDMHKKEGKSPWKIVQELNPGLKTMTARGCIRKKCHQKVYFQTLTIKEKETYNNKFCGKKDSCLIAKALLKNVRDAIAKAESQIASVSPIK